MAFPPLLKRRQPDKASPPPLPAADPQSRTRARRRLIGGAVLVALGVIAFPIVFESQPRPVPVDVSMAIPPRDGSLPATPGARQGRMTSGTIAEAPVPASSALPPGHTASEPVGSTPAQAPGAQPVAPVATPAAPGPGGVVALPAVVPPPQPADAAKPPAKPAEKVAEKPKEKPAERPVDKSAEKPIAKAPDKPVKPSPEKPADKVAEKPADKSADKAASKPAAPSPAAVTSNAVRYVVQVGAYADEASAKDARARVERLGLKTFTQDVDIQGARRIRVRVGPFDSLADAERALATLKAGKLPGAVLKL